MEDFQDGVLGGELAAVAGAAFRSILLIPGDLYRAYFAENLGAADVRLAAAAPAEPAGPDPGGRAGATACSVQNGA
ncbi:MAG: hypothetical protein ACRDN0_32740 [Trebonia sp.]